MLFEQDKHLHQQSMSGMICVVGQELSLFLYSDSLCRFGTIALFKRIITALGSQQPDE